MVLGPLFFITKNSSPLEKIPPNCYFLFMILSALYFILPAYAANMAPVIAGKLNLPLGISIHKKAFGKNKTYRGLIVAYLAAAATLAIQTAISPPVEPLIEYSYATIPLYAFLFGIGALIGDLIKSFFKRRLKRPPGSSWPPFDQIDFILGTYIFFLPVYIIPWQTLLILLVITPILHLAANVTAYALKIKKVWW